MLRRYFFTFVFSMLLVGFTFPVQSQILNQADWLRFEPGTQFRMYQIGDWTSSDGDSGAEGPIVFDLRIEPIDMPIYGQVADRVMLFGDDTAPQSGSYYQNTPQGLMVISDGNPNNGEWYEYYEQGKLMMPDTLSVGHSYPYQTPWHGQWEVPAEYGGGFQAWSGDVSGDIHVNGFELIATPLGDFNALRVTTSELYSKSNHPGRVYHMQMTTIMWLVEGMGPVQMEEFWYEQTFLDGQLAEETNEHYFRQMILPDHLYPGILQGDANGDFVVGLLDLDILGRNWRASGVTAAEGDFNGDGTVGLLDLDILGRHWGTDVSVPEPVSLVMIGASGIVLLRRRIG